jgi:hypothetical protein
VLVLYEDQRRDGDGQRFGLHALVQRCVLDRCSELSYRDLDARLEGRPVKGNNKLLKKCQTELPTLRRTFNSVIAVYDHDRAHRVVNLRGDTCMTALRQALKRGCEPAGDLRVVFVRENTESVLEALREGSLLTTVTAESWRNAIERKDLNDRDLILLAAAKAAATTAREDLVARVPSFDYVIGRVVLGLFPPSPNE